MKSAVSDFKENQDIVGQGGRESSLLKRKLLIREIPEVCQRIVTPDNKQSFTCWFGQ